MKFPATDGGMRWRGFNGETGLTVLKNPVEKPSVAKSPLACRFDFSDSTLPSHISTAMGEYVAFSQIWITSKAALNTKLFEPRFKYLANTGEWWLLPPLNRLECLADRAFLTEERDVAFAVYAWAQGMTHLWCRSLSSAKSDAPNAAPFLQIAQDVKAAEILRGKIEGPIKPRRLFLGGVYPHQEIPNCLDQVIDLSCCPCIITGQAHVVCGESENSYRVSLTAGDGSNIEIAIGKDDVNGIAGIDRPFAAFSQKAHAYLLSCLWEKGIPTKEALVEAGCKVNSNSLSNSE